MLILLTVLKLFLWNHVLFCEILFSNYMIIVLWQRLIWCPSQRSWSHFTNLISVKRGTLFYCPWPTYTILTIVQPSLQESQGKQPRIPQSSLEASATSQTCHSPEFWPCCNRICFSEFCSIKIKQMRVNRGVIPLAKVRPPSCSKPTEMHFQLSYVKLWVYSRQDTDVFTLSPF